MHNTLGPKYNHSVVVNTCRLSNGKAMAGGSGVHGEAETGGSLASLSYPESSKL